MKNNKRPLIDPSNDTIITIPKHFGIGKLINGNDVYDCYVGDLMLDHYISLPIKARIEFVISERELKDVHKQRVLNGDG